MVDVVLIAVAVGFFGLCVAYVRGCERIVSAGRNPSESFGDVPPGGRPEQTPAVSS